MDYKTKIHVHLIKPPITFMDTTFSSKSGMGLPPMYKLRSDTSGSHNFTKL